MCTVNLFPVQLTTPFAESELVSSIRHRNQTAFNHLYDNYSAALFKIIIQIVQDSDEANDVLQKTFVNIWQKIEAYDASKGRLFTWMLNIARNAAIDTLRSKTYQYQRKHQVLPDNQLANLSSNNCYLRVDGIGLGKYVARLKPQQRMLIELVYYKGYSHPEVAAMQDIPLSTIKTRVRTALSQLRMLIGTHN
jgi:RNA polymerase sigma factor (sigma-70 family)